MIYFPKRLSTYKCTSSNWRIHIFVYLTGKTFLNFLYLSIFCCCSSNDISEIWSTEVIALGESIYSYRGWENWKQILDHTLHPDIVKKWNIFLIFLKLIFEKKLVSNALFVNGIFHFQMIFSKNGIFSELT